MGPLTYKVFNFYFSIRCRTYNSHLHTTRTHKKGHHKSHKTYPR